MGNIRMRKDLVKIYICIYKFTRHVSTSIYMYIYVYIYMCIYMYIYVYICIYSFLEQTLLYI